MFEFTETDRARALKKSEQSLCFVRCDKCTYVCLARSKFPYARTHDEFSAWCSSNQKRTLSFSLLVRSREKYLFLMIATAAMLCESRLLWNARGKPSNKMKCDVRFTCLHTNRWKLVLCFLSRIFVVCARRFYDENSETVLKLKSRDTHT